MRIMVCLETRGNVETAPGKTLGCGYHEMRSVFRVAVLMYTHQQN